MPELPEGFLLDALRALVREDAAWVPTERGASLYLRPTMFGSEAYLGVRPSRRYTLFVIASPVGNYFGPTPQMLKLWVETEHVRAARGGIGAAKAGANYVAGMKAAERAKTRGFHQVLWLDQTHRNVEEAGTMNVFFRFGDTVVTPPLEDSLLAGVTRDSVLALLRRWKVRVEERPVAIAEVAEQHAKGQLKEAFGSGTAATVSAHRRAAVGRAEAAHRRRRPASSRPASTAPCWISSPPGDRTRTAGSSRCDERRPGRRGRRRGGDVDRRRHLPARRGGRWCCSTAPEPSPGEWPTPPPRTSTSSTSPRGR